MRIRYRVPESAAGQRLDVHLAAHPDVGSRALAARLIADEAVRVDDRVLSKAHRLEGGELLEIELPEAAAPLQHEAVEFALAYEDEYLLVVDKPAGVVVHPSGGHPTGTLAHGLVGYGAAGGEVGRPGIVHRLDRDTSGLMLVARSEDVHRALQRELRARRVHRHYLALARGTPRSRTGRIEAPIGRDRRDRSRHSLDTTTPRDAVTRFEVAELLEGRVLLELTLETGRTHQIRVHLEAIGLPVCGDPVYGIRGDLGLGRQFLHANRLVLDHPVTGKPLDVRSELPEDLDAALRRARR